MSIRENILSSVRSKTSLSLGHIGLYAGGKIGAYMAYTQYGLYAHLRHDFMYNALPIFPRRLRLQHPRQLI